MGDTAVLLPVEEVPPSIWQPRHLNDAPQPPPPDTREAELQALAAQEKLGHDGKRQRVRARRTVDPYGGMERWRIFRATRASKWDQMFMRQNPSYIIDLLPPAAYDNPSTSYCTKYAHTSTNKIRCPVNIVKWTPDAKRVLTGSTSGEFTLWNGLTFNFETILQAHDSAVRAMEWSPSGVWLISADNQGTIKYFQTNMNNLQAFQGHNESVRDLTWAPNDDRFASAADDGLIKIWNFERMKEEKTLTGHGWDVKCVKWHPTKGLLVSGSKDNLVKFWDPRSAQVLTTLHGHKNTVQALSWSPSGNLVATASRDQLVKVFDIRAMKELVTLRGHKKEVCSVAWHPTHDDHLVSGGSEGSILYWLMPDNTPKDELEFAHDSNVWSLAFHPLGHILCSASNDHTTRFWARNRPAQSITKDRYHIGREKAAEAGMKDDDEDEEDDQQHSFVPGLGMQHGGGRGRGRGGPGRGGYGGRNDGPGGDFAIPGFGRGGGGPGQGFGGPQGGFRNQPQMLPPSQQQQSLPMASYMNVNGRDSPTGNRSPFHQGQGPPHQMQMPMSMSMSMGGGMNGNGPPGGMRRGPLPQQMDALRGGGMQGPGWAGSQTPPSSYGQGQAPQQQQQQQQQVPHASYPSMSRPPIPTRPPPQQQQPQQQGGYSYGYGQQQPPYGNGQNGNGYGGGY